MYVERPKQALFATDLAAWGLGAVKYVHLRSVPQPSPGHAGRHTSGAGRGGRAIEAAGGVTAGRARSRAGPKPGGIGPAGRPGRPAVEAAAGVTAGPAQRRTGSPGRRRGSRRRAQRRAGSGPPTGRGGRGNYRPGGFVHASRPETWVDGRVAGGIAAPGSHRSRRESLPSPGSSHQIAGQ
jgi:hypothetical protein